MALTTRANRMLGIEHPIVQAPMDGIAGGALAAAVTDAGGLGMIGGGYGDPDWLAREFTAAGTTRVGCGFITWSVADRPHLLDQALAHEPAAVMLSFTDPTPLATRVHDAGARLMCQVNTRRQAEQALHAGADIIVAQGTEAGGHGYGPQTTLSLVPEVVDTTTTHAPEAVVLAAGGIADGRGLAAALALGADGVLVGTRFYASTEALSTPPARDRVVAADGADTCRTTIYDTVRTPWPHGHTMNVLRNDFVDRWHGAEDELRATRTEATAEYRQAVTERDYDIANVTAGQAAGLIHEIHPAAHTVHHMVTHAEEILRSRAATVTRNPAIGKNPTE
ncbi:NAD(P)H-dependent flavin oxidoreductase [Halosaccharopolyspora lacisalsi]|nr:nitronate monooxygenase [Halosaccharopolyspora lacisalsi]